MGEKRRSVATSLDEVDRTMHTTFCSAANSLSQLYTQAMNQQKLSFQAGERHGLEKLHQWIYRQQVEGSRVTTVDILTYLQNELDGCGEDPSVSLRSPPPNQHSQRPPHFTNSGSLVSLGSSEVAPAMPGSRLDGWDPQNKNLVFSNALSIPIHRSLQQNRGSTSETPFFHHQNRNRDLNPHSSNDSMDMHADSPGHDSVY